MMSHSMLKFPTQYKVYMAAKKHNSQISGLVILVGCEIEIREF